MIFTPGWIFSHTVYAYQMITVLYMLYGAYVLMKAAVQRREGASVFLLGFLALFITVMNDSLYARDVIETGYYVSLGLFVFMFSQAIMLSLRSTRAMRTVEMQRQALVEANKAYEHEIVERQEAEKAVKESEKKYRTLFEDSLEAMTLTRQGRITDVNPAWLLLHGYQDKGDVLGRDVMDFIYPEDRRILRERRRNQTHKKGEVYQIRDLRLDGSSVYVEIYSSSLSIGGQQTILATIRDVTARMRADLARSRLQAQLQQAQKMEAIGTMAGGIAHDFNNILTGLLGYTELAKMQLPQATKAHKSLDEVLKAGHRARELVQQILAFSRQGSDDRKPVQIVPIVKEALKLLRASLPTTIDIRQNISGDVGIVEADPTPIHQVLMNLCTNAHHAMEGQGGGILEIILSFENLDDPVASDYPDMEAGHYVRLVVRDGGEGIDPEVMDRIFEPYFTTKEKGKGTGMGLAVVHGIVKSYGGGIRVESEPGKGTSVEILLPATGSEPSPAIVIPEPMPTGQEQILFVDDEAPLVNLGRQMLENLGYRVEPRTSPIEAIAAFRAHPDKFDLVITDKTMPFMTGFDLAKEIKAIRPEIPIILCTGFSESADVRRAEALGINETLMKPLVLGDLARIIRQVLEG